MISFPIAKINLGLKVLRKRADGYHDIETVFYPVPLCDILEITENENTVIQNDDFKKQQIGKQHLITLASGKKIFFSASGLKVDNDPSKNLCIKACKVFDQYQAIPFDLSIHLHKIIPMGAGLGGGSSDAAEVLKTLNNLTGSKLSNEDLLSMAAELGSDCSFFINNFPAFAEGRGEILSKLDLDLSNYFMVLVKPDVHVSTVAAFSGIIAGSNNYHLKNCLLKPIQQWQNCLGNDFEETVFRNFPVIREIKDRLLSLGAIYAAMSGSGSTVYGLFDSPPPSADHFMDCSYFCFKK